MNRRRFVGASFDLTINAATAKALCIAIPTPLLLPAAEIVQ